MVAAMARLGPPRCSIRLDVQRVASYCVFQGGVGDAEFSDEVLAHTSVSELVDERDEAVFDHVGVDIQIRAGDDTEYTDRLVEIGQ